MTGRLLAQLAELAEREARAKLDPRALRPADVAESHRLMRLARRLDARAAAAGWRGADPFGREEAAA